MLIQHIFFFNKDVVGWNAWMFESAVGINYAYDTILGFVSTTESDPNAFRENHFIPHDILAERIFCYCICMIECFVYFVFIPPCLPLQAMLPSGRLVGGSRRLWMMKWRRCLSYFRADGERL